MQDWCSPQRAVLRPSKGSPWKFEDERTGLHHSLWSEKVSGIVRNGEMHIGLTSFFLEIRKLRHGVA